MTTRVLSWIAIAVAGTILLCSGLATTLLFGSSGASATWLRHSVHHLDPVEELFVTEPDPHGGAEPAMTVCTVCGAVDEIEYHELPWMTCYGHDTSTACTRCGSSVTTDPMFGAHVNRKPWPPDTAAGTSPGTAR